MIHIHLSCATRAGMGMLVGLFAVASLTVGAQAEQPRSNKDEVRSVYLFKVRTPHEVRYNKNPRASLVTVSAAEYLRSNSYVCTPSGFGQKGRCYVRGLPL